MLITPTYPFAELHCTHTGNAAHSTRSPLNLNPLDGRPLRMFLFNLQTPRKLFTSEVVMQNSLQLQQAEEYSTKSSFTALLLNLRWLMLRERPFLYWQIIRSQLSRGLLVIIYSRRSLPFILWCKSNRKLRMRDIVGEGKRWHFAV